MRRILTAGAAALALSAPASAMPGEAPWGHYGGAAGGPGAADCAECHFDAPARRPSAFIEIGGLPERARAGRAYDLTLRFSAAARVRGFLIGAECGGAPAGVFEAIDGAVEAQGAEARSTGHARETGGDGAVEWRFRWTAPHGAAGEVDIFVAAVAGNDDDSPFGDDVHLRRFSVTVTGEQE